MPIKLARAQFESSATERYGSSAPLGQSQRLARAKGGSVVIGVKQALTSQDGGSQRHRTTIVIPDARSLLDGARVWLDGIAPLGRASRFELLLLLTNQSVALETRELVMNRLQDDSSHPCGNKEPDGVCIHKD